MSEKPSPTVSHQAAPSEKSAKLDTKMAAKESKAAQPAPAKDVSGTDRFLLEKLFPHPEDAFRSSSVPDPKADCLVALDTNALLLPYSVGKNDLKSLREVYGKIAQRGGLFLPERVAREFIKHRDRKLAEILQAIGVVQSKINIGSEHISPVLEGLAEHDSLVKASKDLVAARKAYVAALERLSSQIRSWRGNDPVTSLYFGLFTKDRLIGPGATETELESELAYRFRNKVPPGYKDGSKLDGGLGDLVIWKSLLALGERERKDLIFVTGEEKADWFVRIAGAAAYPRPELIDEYRRASNGCTIRLSSLHDLLREMAAPEQLVAEVEAAELRANTAIQSSASSYQDIVFANYAPGLVPVRTISFDYSTNDGKLAIEHLGRTFDLAFSKASDLSIHLYRWGTTRRIARVKKMAINVPTSIDAQETSSRTYTIQLGEGFLVENDAGDVLGGRILNIKDDTRGADCDEVTFAYTVAGPGTRVFIPD